MNDKGAGVVEQYDISVIKALRGRGYIILETNQGYKRLMEYGGAYSRLEYMSHLSEFIYSHGFKNVDRIMKNKEGLLLSNDNNGDSFIVTDWFSGNECDVKSKNNIFEGASTLATLHNITGKYTCCQTGTDGISIPITDNFLEEYKKHNLELKRAWGYIRGRKHKTEFEYNVLKNMREYLDYGLDAAHEMEISNYKNLEENALNNAYICHGNYNYHNIIFVKNKIAVINFDKSGRGILIKDLYLFFRKVMEKHNWDINTGHEIIKSYDRIRPIPGEEYTLLKIMLSYPEKFWKLVNHYYNGNKAWIPDKDLEKLNTVYMQEEKKKAFIKSMD